MKKIILLTIVSLLSVTYIEAKPQPEQNPYTKELKQATATLKKIGSKIQSYYAKHTQRPDKQNDFAALKMKDPSNKQWKYSFFCEDDNLTPDKHACNVFAE